MGQGETIRFGKAHPWHMIIAIFKTHQIIFTVVRDKLVVHLEIFMKIALEAYLQVIVRPPVNGFAPQHYYKLNMNSDNGTYK